MAAIQGLRGTGEFDTHFRPQNYRELFTLLEPNGTAPLNALLAMTGSESTDDPKYWNFRDELPDRTLNTTAAVVDAVTTTVTVAASDTLAFCVKGAMLVNVATGEVMQVSTDTNPSGTSVEVIRNIGGSTHNIGNGDEIIVAGYAAKEGDGAPTAISFDAVPVYNYVQIFRTAYSVTETAKHTRFRTGAREQEYATKALKMHMSDIERAMLFGNRHIENANSAQPTRYTGGLINNISTQIDGDSQTTAGQITEDEFDNLLIKTVFAFGSNQKLAFVGANVAALLQKMGKDRWQPTNIDGGSYGVKFTKYETFAGDLLVHLHPQFRQIKGMENSMIIIDLPHVKYRYLDGRDTHLLKDRQAPDADMVKHEYLTECGLELTQDKVHCMIRNWRTIK